MNGASIVFCIFLFVSFALRLWVRYRMAHTAWEERLGVAVAFCASALLEFFLLDARSAIAADFLAFLVGYFAPEIVSWAGATLHKSLKKSFGKLGDWIASWLGYALGAIAILMLLASGSPLTQPVLTLIVAIFGLWVMTHRLFSKKKTKKGK